MGAPEGRGLTDEIREKIYWDVLKGDSLLRVAKRYNVHRNTVFSIAHEKREEYGEHRRRARELLAIRCGGVVRRLLERIDAKLSKMDVDQLLRAAGPLAALMEAIEPPDVVNEIDSRGGDIHLYTGLPPPVLAVAETDGANKPS